MFLPLQGSDYHIVAHFYTVVEPVNFFPNLMLNQSVSVELKPKNGHFCESIKFPKIYKVPTVVPHNITEPVLEC